MSVVEFVLRFLACCCPTNTSTFGPAVPRVCHHLRRRHTFTRENWLLFQIEYGFCIIFWNLLHVLFLGVCVLPATKICVLKFSFFNISAHAPRGGGGGGGGGGCIVRSYCVNCLLAFMQASATTFSYVRVSFWLGSARFWTFRSVWFSLRLGKGDVKPAS